jgi:hypothetical protein
MVFTRHCVKHHGFRDETGGVEGATQNIQSFFRASLESGTPKTEKAASSGLPGRPIKLCWFYILRTIDVLCLQSLRAAFDFELNLCTFLQRPVTVHLDGGKVDEHIIAIGALDKSIALRGVKPFHYTFFSHYYLLWVMRDECPWHPRMVEEREAPLYQLRARRITTSLHLKICLTL